MILKDYQIEAVSRLKIYVSEALESTNNVCVFQAPTGSGKTITTAHLLKTLVQEHLSEKPLSFIWVSVGKLHTQSKDKLEHIYEDKNELQCSYFDDLQDNKIQENEIWFINWEKINQIDKNIIVRENETDKYLEKIIQNTREEGRNIMMIIDESHHSAQAERAQELISMISPNAVLEISATPVLKEKISSWYSTDIDDVKDEEMIKNEVLINPKIDQQVIDEQSSTELVIKQSIKKHGELKAMYENEGVSINPLILVQLPNSKSGIQNKIDEIIDEYKKHNITVENEKLAVWLSERHTPNLLNIEKNDSEVDVLLFKQAIAIGWDCPRAAVLVVFRDYKSLQFTIQVIGRIMRMPEQKHYTKNSELNSGYIFTNLEQINLAQEYVEGYAKMYHLERNDKLYTPVRLHSVYLKRQRERTRLSGKFQKMFVSAASETSLHEKLDMSVTSIRTKIITDGIIKDVDKEISEGTSISADGSFRFEISDTEIQRQFDMFVVESCHPFAPYDSGDRLKTAIYNWLYTTFRIEKLSREAHVKILSTKNLDLFRDTIRIAKEKYRQYVIDNIDSKREHIENPEWEVPTMQSMTSGEEQNYRKYVMKPAYVKAASGVEKKFMEKLESEEFSDKIMWWYKNSEREIKYFAIPYVDKLGFEWAFYVDFIIKFADGRIGLFDTKSGITAEKAKYKAEGLAKYIREHTTKKRTLFGGIIVNRDGVWLYNDNDVYEYDQNNFSKWKPL